MEKAIERHVRGENGYTEYVGRGRVKRSCVGNEREEELNTLALRAQHAGTKSSARWLHH